MSPSQELLLFEDPGVEKLHPLTLTHPVYDLRCGVLTLAEKVAHHFPGWTVSYQCRDYIQRVLKAEDPPRRIAPGRVDRLLLVNGRVVMDEDLARLLREAPGEVVFRRGEETVAAWIGRTALSDLEGRLGAPLDEECFSGMAVEEVEAHPVHYLWELLAANGAEIAADLERISGPGGNEGRVSSGAHIEEPQAVRLGRARIDAGAVIDARPGPVYLADGVRVSSHALIEGPAAIGGGSLVKAGAHLSEGVTLGPGCKAGGEIGSSIIQGYSNKQHAGFLGHSYLGEWVNLGAGTETSDLKNNYSPVRVRLGGEEVDTGSLFLGLMMGDHAKSAIGTRFATGAVVGVACNYFAPWMSPRHIPSFTWFGPQGEEEYHPDRALETARRVMARRGRELSAPYEAMLRTVFRLTAGERE